MSVPTLDLHGFKHDEVENEVARFLNTWLGKHLMAYFIVGHSEKMSELVLNVVKDYGLEYKTDLPGYPGRIRVVMYEFD